MPSDFTVGGAVSLREIPPLPDKSISVRRQTDNIGSNNPAGGEVARERYTPTPQEVVLVGT